MNALQHLFFNNDTLDAELNAFCESDPEYRKRQQQFYDLLKQIAPHISHDLSDDLEKSFNDYLFHTADLYYLFGLGFRQELLRTLGG